MLDRGAVTSELMRYLDIRNAELQTVRLSDEDADSIKAYLKRLDLVRDCPVRQLRGGKVVETVRPLFTQPGMRFCQAEALVRAIVRDSSFARLPSAEREYVSGRLALDRTVIL